MTPSLQTPRSSQPPSTPSRPLRGPELHGPWTHFGPAQRANNRPQSLARPHRPSRLRSAPRSAAPTKAAQTNPLTSTICPSRHLIPVAPPSSSILPPPLHSRIPHSSPPPHSNKTSSRHRNHTARTTSSTHPSLGSRLHHASIPLHPRKLTPPLLRHPRTRPSSPPSAPVPRHSRPCSPRHHQHACTTLRLVPRRRHMPPSQPLVSSTPSLRRLLPHRQ